MLWMLEFTMLCDNQRASIAAVLLAIKIPVGVTLYLKSGCLWAFDLCYWHHVFKLSSLSGKLLHIT
jgi:hypothetical protein